LKKKKKKQKKKLKSLKNFGVVLFKKKGKKGKL